MDNDVDEMGIQKLMELGRNHEEEQHISQNVPIGERNPKLFQPQGPDIEEWDAADDAEVDDTQ